MPNNLVPQRGTANEPPPLWGGGLRSFIPWANAHGYMPVPFQGMTFGNLSSYKFSMTFIIQIVKQQQNHSTAPVRVTPGQNQHFLGCHHAGNTPSTLKF